MIVKLNEKQEKTLFNLLYNISKYCRETWTDDELKTYYWLDNVYVSEKDMEIIKEIFLQNKCR